MKARHLARLWLKKLIFMTLAFGLCLILLFPLLWMVSGSIKSIDETFDVPPTLFPQKPTTAAYVELLKTTDFVRFFRNSLIVSISSSALALVLSIGGVYGLTRYRLIGGNLFSYMILFTYMLPSILLVIPLFTLWINLGMSDTLSSVSLTYVSFTLPFALWMMRSYIGTIPREIEEAGMVDGATRFQSFRRLILPQAIPGMLSTFIFTFILAWQEYLYALVLITSDKNKTITLGVANLIGSRAINSWPVLNASGVLATIPVLLLFIVAQRWLVGGFTAGAVKG
ncbi:MAG: carbohydrate ABC transporter permease [Chloroflexi bacterium]|nr:carbohydrate ABC transporter permease [Chloroflexota bacterium]